MPSHAVPIHVVFLIQALEAVLVAAALTGYRQRHHRPGLGDWARAWWALAAHLALSGGGMAAATTLGALHPVTLTLAGAAGVALLWHLGWLVRGGRRLLGGRGPRPPVRRLRLAAAAFLAYGAGQTAILALGVGELAGDGVGAAVTGYLGLADLLLLSAVGLGMLAWLLEEERWRALRASDHAARLARRDPLTGLANRSALLDRLEKLLASPDGERGRTGGAVIHLDLARFKVINDSMGQPFGDRVLEALARRLESALGDHETVARIAGDEFMLLLPGVTDEAAAAAAARQFLELVRQPLKVDGREIFVGACAGVSLFPRDGTDAQRLVKNAETALHGAKEAGGGGLRVFQPHMHVEANRTLSLETRLRRALDQDELTLFYQPVVSLSDDRLVGFEALMRWRLRPHRYLRPDRFLPLAESIGLVEEFDRWALATAAAQLRDWHRAGYDGLSVAINLSARRFENPDLPQRVGEALRRNGLPPDAIELEITETVAMRDPAASTDVLEALKELGVRVAIDDFGTAYSSLLYLRSFPIDSLKIDRSFVRGIVDEVADQEIAASLIRLAHALGVTVVGEGVETAEQLEALRHHGCDRVQGYYLSPPTTAAECDRLLERGPWRPARDGGGRPRRPD